jgi:hypothetical protein
MPPVDRLVDSGQAIGPARAGGQLEAAETRGRRIRNYGASLGFAILGTILLSQFRSALTASLTTRGLPGPAAATEAARIAQLQGGSGNGNIPAIPLFIRADFASATQHVLYAMAVIMAIAALVALRGLRRGVQDDEQETAQAQQYSAAPGTPTGRRR